MSSEGNFINPLYQSLDDKSTRAAHADQPNEIKWMKPGMTCVFCQTLFFFFFFAAHRYVDEDEKKWHNWHVHADSSTHGATERLQRKIMVTFVIKGKAGSWKFSVQRIYTYIYVRKRIFLYPHDVWWWRSSLYRVYRLANRISGNSPSLAGVMHLRPLVNSNYFRMCMCVKYYSLYCESLLLPRILSQNAVTGREWERKRDLNANGTPEESERETVRERKHIKLKCILEWSMHESERMKSQILLVHSALSI